MARTELVQRVVVAVAGIPIAVTAIYMGGWVLGGVLALVAAGGAIEVYRLAALRGIRPFMVAGGLAAGLYVLVAAGRPSVSDAVPVLWVMTLALMLGLAVAAIWRRGTGGTPLESVSITLAGALLTGGTLTYAIFLRHLLPDGAPRALPIGVGSAAAWAGAAIVAYPVALTWINDSCAFFGGRRWGRRKLAPVISPGKTVEGAVSGMTGTVIVGMVYAALIFEHWLGLPFHPWLGAVGGALISVVAQLGDLVESLIKREAGVKDSGRIFPGHGGILDRFDALFFTLPVAYWYLAVVVASMGDVPWR